jgi:hypothetical protein
MALKKEKQNMKNKYLKIFLAGIAIPLLLGATASQLIQQGIWVGTFYGTGSGITNVVASYVNGTLTNVYTGPAVYVSGAVLTNSTSGFVTRSPLTNDITGVATRATYLAGALTNQITVTNLPTGLFSGTRTNVTTNCAATGYLTNYIVVTNGAISSMGQY